MGTSTSYDAPPSWGPLKSQVTRFAGAGSLSSARAGELVREFVAHNGGATAASHGGGTFGRGRAAQTAGRALAGFVGLASRVGLDEALRRSGLGDLVGRSVTDIILALVDHCGGPGSSIDEVDARNATSRLLHEMLDEAPDAEAVDAILKEVGEGDGLVSLLERFFGLCLYEQFCRVFFERLVKKHGDDRARSFLGDIFHFIRSALSNRLIDVDVKGVNWFGDDGRRISDDIMEQTLRVFES